MSILETICPNWRVLSSPTLLNNAAWIPYRCALQECQGHIAGCLPPSESCPKSNER